MTPNHLIEDAGGGGPPVAHGGIAATLWSLEFSMILSGWADTTPHPDCGPHKSG
jgi:hypothetical protein